MTTRTRKGKLEWCKTDLSQILSRFTKSELVAMWEDARARRITEPAKPRSRKP